MSPSTLINVIVLSTLVLVASSPGQTLAPSAPPAPDWLPGSSHVVVPQTHVFSSVAAVGPAAPGPQGKNQN